MKKKLKKFDTTIFPYKFIYFLYVFFSLDNIFDMEVYLHYNLFKKQETSLTD